MVIDPGPVCPACDVRGGHGCWMIVVMRTTVSFRNMPLPTVCRGGFIVGFGSSSAYLFDGP